MTRVFHIKNNVFVMQVYYGRPAQLALTCSYDCTTGLYRFRVAYEFSTRCASMAIFLRLAKSFRRLTFSLFGEDELYRLRESPRQITDIV